MAALSQRSPILSTLPSNLPATLLKEITLDFCDERKIGQGAYGTVYMGEFEDGTRIAVKRLTGEDTYDKQFQNEILNLMAIDHKNIVRIVGYCHEAQKNVVEHNRRYIIAEIVERVICYEYLPKGSIDKYIYDNNTLDWGTRFKIIKGICQGLHFLHRRMGTPMVHMSLQPANILLDDHNVPKIADFGASRVFSRADQTRMMTLNHVGVRPYMAPEYLKRGEISTQSDIYSLGLMIIEITIMEKNRPETRDLSARSFIEKVRETWTYDKIMSTYSSLEEDSLQEVKTCIETGLKCVDIDRKKRPSISEIIDSLNGPRA